MKFSISTSGLELKSIPAMLSPGATLQLDAGAEKRIKACREFLDMKLAGNAEAYYGINTGFGSLHNTRIATGDIEALQANLIRSHACGTGDPVPGELVRAMLLLKIQGLALGHSGVTVALVQRLIDLYNHDVLPVVFEKGSLGASGDLAPLAHLALPLIGEGEVHYKGVRKPAKAVLRSLGWNPLKLKAKEGLALLNGTQFMGAYAVDAVVRAMQLSDAADAVSALSCDAFDGQTEPFDALVHRARPHPGQVRTAERLRRLLKGSALAKRKKEHVQDPYAFRCIPQVHGASKDAIGYAAGVVQTEINAVTDNPTLFPEEDRILSAGNFHGQPLALAMDFLAIAVAELGSISERRTYQLIAGQRGLPPFLAVNPGLHSGLMIPQYTAAALVSQNKQLCTPASVDSIVSSNGQEDHVSMGANAALKLRVVVENVERIVGIELLTAAQALEFRRPARTSPPLEKWVAAYRKKVPFVGEDRVLAGDIAASAAFIREVRGF